jgi:hypothetical protein
MLALLSYPVAIEPWLTTHQQQIIWSFAFGAFRPALRAHGAAGVEGDADRSEARRGPRGPAHGRPPADVAGAAGLRVGAAPRR